MLSVVGFKGEIGSGKTTAAKYLVDFHGWQRHRFAYYLKEMLRNIGLTEAQLDGDLKQVEFVMPNFDNPYTAYKKMLQALDVTDDDFSNPDYACSALIEISPTYAIERLIDLHLFGKLTTPRIVMQLIGTEWGRALNQNFWIEKFRRRIDPVVKSGVGVVIDDCRFPNELTFINEYGGKVIEIQNTNNIVDYKGIAGHASEQQKFTADALIVNEGTSLIKFYKQIEETLSSLQEN